MKKILLFSWYLLGVLVSLPALIFLIISRWMGIRAENKALRDMTEEDLNAPNKD